MIKDQRTIPVDVVKLFPELDNLLLQLFKSLTAADWEKRTVAKLWTVKDVAAHLLDGNIRILSMLRDNYFGEQPKDNSYRGMVDYLNGLNADWVKAMKRVSPAMLVFLHEATGHLYCDYYASLDPFGKSAFAVDWAGEKESLNWMQTARDYTEKWLHQQQIRDAVNDKTLMTRSLFYPFIDIFMLALPHTYRQVEAADGTIISIVITGEAGGTWNLRRSKDAWVLDKNEYTAPDSRLMIAPDIAWKLFSKSTRPEQVRDKIQIEGDSHLAEVSLSMVSVMA